MQFWGSLVFKRFLIIVISSVAILSSAASCSLPGILGFDSGSAKILGMLKRDPSRKAEGFGKINHTLTIYGQDDANGLGTLSGLKLHQVDAKVLYVLTKQKGLFKTDNAGVQWKRQYVFPLDQKSLSSEANERNKQVQDFIAKNDAFVTTDFAVDPADSDRIYISGNIGGIAKIFQTVDGGETFREIYTEVRKNSTVNLLAMDPENTNRVFALLDGGALLRSLDGGINWQKVRVFENIPVQIGFLTEPNPLFYILLKNNGVGISKDSGTTWEISTLNKGKSAVGANQPQDTSNIFGGSSGKFGTYEKLIPIVSTQTDTPKLSWILLADRQMWYGQSLTEPMIKIELPVQAEQVNVLDVGYHPNSGENHFYVSIDNKLWETTDRGKSWSTNDKIGLGNDVGNIGQVLIDQDDPEVIYLMLISPSIKRTNGLFI